VNFFIEGVPTYEGTARIAIKTRAEVLFGVSTRNTDGTYSLKFHEIDTSMYKESTEENVRALTQAHVDLLVEYIKLRPDHWLWFRFRMYKRHSFQNIRVTCTHPVTLKRDTPLKRGIM
jgi:lauroyl/myristoyl acyltransferase